MSKLQVTIMEAHQRMTEYLQRQGVEQPRLCSEIIISRALEMEKVQIYSRFDELVSTAGLDAARTMGKRLAAGEPIQLVVGDAQFFSYFIKVRKGVFIPRPETETLVDATATALRKIAATKDTSPSLLDVCTGSGVIAVTLAKLVNGLVVKGVDISGEAVELSNENAARLGVAERCSFLNGDLFEPLKDSEMFDAITANPPYIPTEDVKTLETVVRDYDPHKALDGGNDGLDVVRKIAEQSRGRLMPGGFLIMEIGVGQAQDTARIMEKSGLADMEILKDLSGIDRVVMGWNKCTQ